VDTYWSSHDDYDRDSDTVRLRENGTPHRTIVLSSYLLEYFERVPMAADQGNSGQWSPLR
jgi:hypothetical protein